MRTKYNDDSTVSILAIKPGQLFSVGGTTFLLSAALDPLSDGPRLRARRSAVVCHTGKFATFDPTCCVTPLANATIHAGEPYGDGSLTASFLVPGDLFEIGSRGKCLACEFSPGSCKVSTGHVMCIRLLDGARETIDVGAEVKLYPMAEILVDLPTPAECKL